MTKPAIASPRRLPIAVAGLLVLSILSCAPRHDLVVRVGDIPDGTASLRVLLWLDRQQSTDVAEYPIDPQQKPVYYSLGLRLLNRDAGSALVNIAAFNADGCLLTSKFSDFTNVDLATTREVAIKLDRAPSELLECKKGEPLLIASNSDDACGSADHRLTLSGWGFHPQAQIKTDGTLRSDAVVVAGSRVEIPLNLPQGSGATMISVEITNPDGAKVSGTYSVTAPLFSCEPDTVTFSYPADKLRQFSGITVADLNGDGWLEIILIGATEDPAGPGFVSVLTNRDGRHFYEGPLKHLSGEVPRTVQTGMYSGMLPLDVVVGDALVGMGRGRVQLLHPISQNGDFDLATGCSVHSSGLPWAMAPADLDGDGALDLAVVTNCADNPYLLNCHSGDALHIYRNVQGTLSLKESCNDSTAAFMGVVAGRFLDPTQPAPDLALVYTRSNGVTGNPGTQTQLRIVRNPTPASGAWKDNYTLAGGGVNLQVPGSPTRMLGGDFNKDGLHDLAITSFPPANGSGYSLAVYLNAPFGLNVSSLYQGGSAGPSPIDLALVNYYGDTSRDLLVINARGAGFTTTAGLLANDVQGKFAAPAEIRTTQDPATWVAVGDLDRDGRDDMLLLDSGENTSTRKQSGSLTILFGTR